MSDARTSRVSTFQMTRRVLLKFWKELLLCAEISSGPSSRIDRTKTSSGPSYPKSNSWRILHVRRKSKREMPLPKSPIAPLLPDMETEERGCQRLHTSYIIKHALMYAHTHTHTYTRAHTHTLGGDIVDAEEHDAAVGTAEVEE